MPFNSVIDETSLLPPSHVGMCFTENVSSSESLNCSALPAHIMRRAVCASKSGAMAFHTLSLQHQDVRPCPRKMKESEGMEAWLVIANTFRTPRDSYNYVKVRHLPPYNSFG